MQGAWVQMNWVADLQCRLLSVVVAAAYQITRGARVERRCCCWWWASDSSQSRVLCTPYARKCSGHPTAQDWRTGRWHRHVSSV